jgi:undecaprenyl-diphosphatase
VRALREIFATVGGLSIRALPALIIVAFLPAVVTASRCTSTSRRCSTNRRVAVSFRGGIVIIERYAQRQRVKSVDDIDWKTALFMASASSPMIPACALRRHHHGRTGSSWTVRPQPSSPSSWPSPTSSGDRHDLYRNWTTLDWPGGRLIAIGFARRSCPP